MPCKYLTKKMKRLQPEVGGSLTPSMVPVPSCQLGRLNQIDSTRGEAIKCKETESTGPCWWWQENYPDEVDHTF